MFEPDQMVEVRYSLSREQEQGDRSSWPWLSGSIIERCGRDEWYVCVEDARLAVRDDGSPPRPGNPSDSLLYPRCFRDASELRPPA